MAAMINIRIEQEFGVSSSVDVTYAGILFRETTLYFEKMLDEQKTWYLKGGSRKQALQPPVFIDATTVSDVVLSKWEKRYKKNYPFFGEGIWDGEKNEISAAIDLTSSCSNSSRRNNPMSLVIEFPVYPQNTILSSGRMLNFIHCLILLNDNCTYLSVESEGYSFPKIISKYNGYAEVYKKVFADRISCGWMLFIPAIILPHLIPEAARVVPVMKGNRQTGTIVVSTDDIFDGNNIEHIRKANDIEIRLLDLGLLPLMTEL
ncbi:Imm52 family immunity protein [Cronobacter sakazakii]|uniref:Imm52 family immunity protein n=1 Tax=Cronobacter sakazakii TaxID=28141 RepID=UPI002893A836|nr:Imm52 family immunity protein [Cronobacter sakazakii]MDT3591643.1 Imm52 family immunity protein [Cronobacter sakazakii]